MANFRILDQFPALYSAAHPVQTGFRIFCQLVVRVFYRRFEVEGLERIPRSGPVILCANHPSALVDAVIIQAVIPRIANPLARSGLFRNPFLLPLLKIIQAVPIFRKEDQGADTNRNTDSFVKCYERLGKGGLLLIFPEGVTHADSRLKDFRTGAARLALGALRINGRAPQIIPVGLNFSDLGMFRSSVFIKVGKPLADIWQHPEESEEEAARRITQSLRAAMVGVVLSTESWEDQALLRRLDRFFALRTGKLKRRSLGQQFRSQRKLAEAQYLLKREHPELVARTQRHLSQFERLCGRIGVQDYHLSLDYSVGLVARYMLRSLLILGVGVPLALWGGLNAFLPFLVTGSLAITFSKDLYHYDTAKILIGLVVFGAAWSAQTLAVYALLGPGAAVVYGLSLAPSAAMAQFMRKERRRLVDNIKAFFLFLRRRDLRTMLLEKRIQLERELAQLTRLAYRSHGER